MRRMSPVCRIVPPARVSEPERQEGLSTPLRLRPRQLEMRALQLVDLVLAGGRVEDDLVECKGQWPDPQMRSSARQLAGHANKARDEPILWIIGLDEKTHTLTSPAPVEVADWWAPISSRFDPPAPTLEHHLIVPVDEHQAVTALRFLTDRSPYVIKGGGQDGSLEREVPIRDGTGTRSARRDELLRLLLPAVGPPSAQLLSAVLRASHYPRIEGQTTSSTSVYLTATVFFEQPPLATGVVMLPKHLMHARLDLGSSFGFIRGELSYYVDQGVRHQPAFSTQQNGPIVVTPPTTLHGVDRRSDGVVITGPGTLTVTAATQLDGDVRSALSALGVVQIHLSLGVAGVDRRIELTTQLDYVPNDDHDPRSVEWRFTVPAQDPWAEAAVHFE